MVMQNYLSNALLSSAALKAHVIKGRPPTSARFLSGIPLLPPRASMRPAR